MVISKLACAVLGIAAGVSASPAEARRAPVLELRLRVRVARCSGRPVVGTAWASEHVRAANEVFAPHRVRLRPTFDQFDETDCSALDRAGRDRFARHVDRALVTVLVLERLRDVDHPDHDLMGVHWRAAGRRFVILSLRARTPVLAHELGHYFGLRHDPRGGNLMTPGPTSARHARMRPFAPRLTPSQARRLRRALAAFIERRARSR